MSVLLRRSIDEPIRAGLSWDERWKGPDRGLIWCWERGRQKAVDEPELAARAKSGELVMLAWRGGVETKRKQDKSGTLQYLAAWQGLRGEDLDLTRDTLALTCTKTGQTVIFKGAPAKTDEA